jgi:hypothetical protein
MTDLIVVPQQTQWHKLKALVLDSVSSPITKRVYNLGLDEFFAWFSHEHRPGGFTKAAVAAWRVALEARGLPLWDSGVRQSLKKAAAAEGCDFPGLGPHSFRRANITWRQEVGGSSIEASKIAGHSTVRMTKEYTKILIENALAEQWSIGFLANLEKLLASVRPQQN